MTKPIRSIAVLGSGVMGSAIAAHAANAGLEVVLLDIVPPGLDAAAKSKAARNGLARGALKRMAKQRPAPFTHADNAALIQVGNLEDDLDRVSKVDLVVEAVIERLDIKRQLFERLDQLAAEDTILASNTSGLRIADMLQGRSERFRKHFLVTHFFNPPRYMKLLEIVSGPDTDPAVIERVRRFGVDVLGKGIVVAKDSPNFVANRIGAHAMMVAIHKMLEMGLRPEDVDGITGIPLGRPKSATFRTADLVGLDTLAHVVQNCYDVLTEDEDRDVFQMPAFVKGMIERKILGDKSSGGFYRKTKAGIETLDRDSFEYAPRAGDDAIRNTTKDLAREADATIRVKKTVETEGVVGEFAWAVVSRSLAYSARRVGEICDDVTAIDDGMRWGYNWDLGPFEVWDALGFEQTTQRMKSEGIALPKSIDAMLEAGAESFYDGDRVFDLLAGKYVERAIDPREKTLPMLRRGEKPVLANLAAEAWDLGDGVLSVTFKTKANSIDGDVVQLLNDAIDRAEQDFAGVLLANQGDHFCVGANLFFVLMAAKQKQFDAIEKIVTNLQMATHRMKYAKVPVVTAPFGMTLGGGLELCLGADAVQASLETYAGCVEVGVGLIPAGGGCANLLWRALSGIPEGVHVDPYAVVTQVFKNIALAKVSTSAEEAKRFGYFYGNDGVSFDRARQLFEAKQRVLGLAGSGYHPPLKRSFTLPGESGIATLKMMVNTLVSGRYATEHDALIADKLAGVLCGGVGGAGRAVSELEILELEREAFLSLCGEEKTHDRMQHMLEKNKPLRN